MGKIDLKNLKEDNLIEGLNGKKVVIYGSNDCGKTYQSTKFDKPLLLMTESGGSALKCKKVSITKWSEFKDVVDTLTNSKTYAEMFDLYQTIIIDTAENLVSLSEQSVANEYGVRDLSEITGKQNGWKIARTDFSMQINKLTSVGYFVICIMHEETIEKIDEVTKETYQYFQPKNYDNPKSSMRFLVDDFDYVIFTRPNGIDAETYETIPSTAICKRTKTNFARSRFKIKTFIDPFTADELKSAIIDSVEKSAKEEGVGIEKYKNKKQKWTKKDYFDLIAPYIKRLSKTFANDISTIVETELGSGRKITSATDDELINLDNIYNRLVTLATSLDIAV